MLIMFKVAQCFWMFLKDCFSKVAYSCGTSALSIASKNFGIHQIACDISNVNVSLIET